MVQPFRFKDTTKPHYVYNLLKSLNGLKQGPRACYDEICFTLLQQGFWKSVMDTSLFVLHKN